MWPTFLAATEIHLAQVYIGPRAIIRMNDAEPLLRMGRWSMILSARRVALPASLFFTFSVALTSLDGCGGDSSSGAPLASEPDASVDASTSVDASPSVDASADVGEPQPDAEPQVDAGKLGTVAGKVLSDSENVEGVKIVIGDKTATTDANGTYKIDGVTFPYTLNVIVPTELTPAKRAPNVSIFPGLSTPNPVVEVSVRVTHAEANYKGRIEGGVATATADSRFRVDVFGAGTESGSGQYAFGKTGDTGRNFEATMRWPLAQSTQSGHIVALVYTFAPGRDDFNNPGIPLSYEYASSTDVFGERGKSYTNPFFPPFTKPATTIVNGIILAPSGYTVKRHYLKLGNSADSVNGFQFNEATSSTAFTYQVPKVAILNAITITATGTDPNGGSSTASIVVPPGASGVDLRLTNTPEIIGPADNAAGIKTGDVVSWKPAGDDCLYKASFGSSTDGAPSFYFTTTETQVALPDLGAFGAGLPVSTKYSWSVGCVRLDKAKPNIDDAVKLGGVSSHSSSSAASRTLLTL